MSRQHPRHKWVPWVRWVLILSVAGGAAVALFIKRHELREALVLLGHARWWAVVAGLLAELGSFVCFAGLQRQLLCGAGTRMSMGQWLQVVVVENALGVSLPGGPAWSNTWTWTQLRRRGVGNTIIAWVLLVAGAVSAFAMFVILLVGVWIAGARGPLAPARWLFASLAAVAVALAVAHRLARRSKALRVVGEKSLAWLESKGRVGRTLAGAYRSMRTVRLPPRQWAAISGFALLNWLADAGCLVAAMWALAVPVPWRGLLVAYGLARVSDNIPITPGGLGVVEASLTALLVAYGMLTHQALAVVLLYRLMSFWCPVLVGWGRWWYLVTLQRRGDGTKELPHFRYHGRCPVAL